MYVSLGVYAAKELLKAVVIAVSLCRGEVHIRLRNFVATSLFAPLLVLRARIRYRDDVVGHKPSVSDLMWYFFYEGMCENLPQLALSVYFVLQVNQVGLRWTDVLSIIGTVVGTTKVLVEAALLYCRRSEPSTALSQPLLMNERARI